MKLYGYVPLWHVAIDVLAIGAESAMNGAELVYAGVVDALQCANPQLDVGVDRVFDKYGHFGVALQGVGNLLHGERVGAGARANPQDVDTGVEHSCHVGTVSHLGGC